MQRAEPTTGSDVTVCHASCWCRGRAIRRRGSLGRSANMKKWAYLTLQLAVLVVPPFLAACVAAAVHRTGHLLENAVIYLSGVSGLALILTLTGHSGIGGIGYRWPFLLFLPLFLGVAWLLYSVSYSKEARLNAIFIGINSWLSVWSLFVGAFFMFLARQ